MNQVTVKTASGVEHVLEGGDLLVNVLDGTLCVQDKSTPAYAVVGFFAPGMWESAICEEPEDG